MKVGVMMFPSDQAIAPHELAREVEDRGFESLWFPEHTHIPVSRRTAYPGGGELPEEYKRTHDPFVAFGACAAVTSTLLFGTGICLVAQRDPIVTAKEVASLDLISAGRFLFGIGYGWNVDEMEHHGVDPKTRRALVREKVLAMKALWSQEEASFSGEHVELAPTWSWPKPVQQPHPPIHMGGAAGPTLFRHVVEYCDGWMPIGGRGLTTSLTELARVAEEAGRDPATVQISIYGAMADPGKLERYCSLGAVRTILGVPPLARDAVLPILDHQAKVVAEMG